ncbi:hypothetical protein S7711_10462 [Stachybotrys chartarum IBT 7711]|uniref:Uncharacterized protein n=1 Tax=Stachybotrys chartarum (strain CBS 109288 / IBT 7711) TaxID=1280523 RepID=A0A084B6Y4_STACB|nr:hypothetical protein S7711_10462 [Stachybotrys chartarum IBT 7711]KFA55128.1 hypothetical protein S40293_10710 [Stachybotrys chartarum IBT 40293]KFA77847.1 hypothetical protein S40288_10481 [Stachybotrys chartarum IBT 40288]
MAFQRLRAFGYDIMPLPSALLAGAFSCTLFHVLANPVGSFPATPRTAYLARRTPLQMLPPSRPMGMCPWIHLQAWDILTTNLLVGSPTSPRSPQSLWPENDQSGW